MGNYEACSWLDYQHGGNDNYAPPSLRCLPCGIPQCLPGYAAANKHEAVARDAWGAPLHVPHPPRLLQYIQFHAKHYVITIKRSYCTRERSHDALDDFWWMHQNIATRPTQIAEVVPLPPMAEGHHDVSGMGAGEIWFPGPLLRICNGCNSSTPVVWPHRWPQHVISQLVTDSNPCSSITNVDLELAGGLLHLGALSNCFNIRECTILSKGDNLSTTFWEQKGSTSTSAAPANLLCLFGIHQRIHCYIPRFDYISGASNRITNALSQDFHLPWSHMLVSLSHYLPQLVGCQLWTPSKHIVSAVTLALLRQPSSRESLLAVHLAAPKPGVNGSTSPVTLASMPFSKPSKTKFLSYKSLPSKYILANLQSAEIPSGLDRLKITYGTLRRRSSIWGPKTHGSTLHTRSISAFNGPSACGNTRTPRLSASSPSPSLSSVGSQSWLRQMWLTTPFQLLLT
jgi:hypothetical protein